MFLDDGLVELENVFELPDTGVDDTEAACLGPEAALRNGVGAGVEEPRRTCGDKGEGMADEDELDGGM